MNTKSKAKRPGRPPDLALPRVEHSYDPPDELPGGVVLSDKAKEYLRALSRVGVKTYAASVADVAYQTVCYWRREWDGFADEELNAVQGVIDAVEWATAKSSITGEHVPSSVARQRMFLLERWRPERYAKPAEKRELSGKFDLNIQTDWVSMLCEGMDDPEGEDAGKDSPTDGEESGGEEAAAEA